MDLFTSWLVDIRIQVFFSVMSYAFVLVSWVACFVCNLLFTSLFNGITSLASVVITSKAVGILLWHSGGCVDLFVCFIAVWNIIFDLLICRFSYLGTLRLHSW